MTCEHVDELLGAYALGAVDDEERDAVEAHLGTCARHGEAAELRAVALGLGTLPTEREPSEALEARLMASIGAGGDASAGGDAAPVPLRPAGERALPRWPAAVAAAVVIGVLGFAGGVLLTGGDKAPSEVVHVYRDGSAWMRLERAGDASTVAVTMDGLEARPAGEAYQVWAIRDDRWLSVGVCNTDEDDWWHGEFDFEVQPSDRFALTVEPAGGSPRPTGEPVLGAAE